MGTVLLHLLATFCCPLRLLPVVTASGDLLDALLTLLSPQFQEEERTLDWGSL